MRIGLARERGRRPWGRHYGDYLRFYARALARC
jgi:hypothetical protein